jgi:hemerythrin
MPIIDWDDVCLLGVKHFDEHHEHLITLLNQTYDMLIKSEPAENLGKVLDELIDYADYHFEAEERSMHENGYAQMFEHIHEHEAFYEQVLRFRQDFVDGKALVTVGVLTFLKDWLINHITKSDADFAVFINAKDISSHAVSGGQG